MQNKPNFQNEEANATSYAAKTYKNKPPLPAQKNKPNQTQLIAAKPAWGGAKPDQTQPCRGVAPSEAGSPRPLCALTMPALTLGTLVHFSHFILLTIEFS
jgi:hypothetical protein